MVFKDEVAISALTALNDIAARVHNGAYDEETIFRLFLTGVTADEGLGFSRAMVFVLSEDERFLKGRLAIGAQTKNEAELTWMRFKNTRAKGASKLEVLRDCWMRQRNACVRLGKDQRKTLH